MAECKAYVAGHGGLYLVLTKWDSRAFEWLFCNSFNLQQRRQWLHVFRLPVCRSIRQSNRVDWLLSFSKMTSIFRQCPFGNSFPARAKILCSPTNQMPASTATSRSYIWMRAKITGTPPTNTRVILAPPTLSISVISCLLLAHVLALVPVSRVTTPQLSSPGSSMSATNRGLVQGLYHLN